MKFNFIKNNNMENLYDYFLHYNIYTEEWYAVLRTEVTKYMSGGDVFTISDKNLNNLIEKINSLEVVEK